jgi:hypothetical protein
VRNTQGIAANDDVSVSYGAGWANTSLFPARSLPIIH